jgi:hypothetical protein
VLSILAARQEHLLRECTISSVFHFLWQNHGRACNRLAEPLSLPEMGKWLDRYR